MDDGVWGRTETGDAYALEMTRASSHNVALNSSMNESMARTISANKDLRYAAGQGKMAAEGLRVVLGDMMILGIVTEDQYRSLRELAAVMVIGMNVMAMWSAIKRLVEMRTAIIASIAAFETSAHIAAQDYASPVFAAAVASIVAGLGYLGGSELATITRSHNVNINTAQGIREVGHAVREVSG